MIYISRTLTETEQRYSNIERELLAVVFAPERLNHYTAGYSVKVETDHEPPDEHMEEVNCKHKYQSPETITQTTTSI